MTDTIDKPEPPVGEGIRSTLYSWITVPSEDDHPPPFPVTLEHVPVIGVRTAPVTGLSMCYGKGDIPDILQTQILAAEAEGRRLYEVRAIVDVAHHLPVTALDVSTLQADRQRPPGARRTHVLNLHRARPDADEYLRALLEDEIRGLSAEFDDIEIIDWRLGRIVSRYPHLLDLLAQQPELSHVIMFVWQADMPGQPGAGNDPAGRIRGAKVATLYRPERLVELRTLNSDHAYALLPEALRLRMSASPDAEAAIGLAATMGR